mgnify:CR=1 FL=1
MRPTIVVPFRAGGKSRLPARLRRPLALAMLGDVLEQATAAGQLRLVTDDVGASDLARELGAIVIADPGGGQGPAVAAALSGIVGPCLVVNADLPLVTATAIERLGAATPALVAARDGTTNALSLPGPDRFAQLYGPRSAVRFAALGLAPVSIPELELDVDTLADLERLTLPPGRRTRRVVNHHTPHLARAS